MNVIRNKKKKQNKKWCTRFFYAHICNLLLLLSRHTVHMQFYCHDSLMRWLDDYQIKDIKEHSPASQRRWFKHHKITSIKSDFFFHSSLFLSWKVMSSAIKKADCLSNLWSVFFRRKITCSVVTWPKDSFLAWILNRCGSMKHTISVQIFRKRVIIRGMPIWRTSTDHMTGHSVWLMEDFRHVCLTTSSIRSFMHIL